MNVNDCFSHELGGDTLSEYIYSNVKKRTKGDYFPAKNSEDLIGEGGGGDSEEPIETVPNNMIRYYAPEILPETTSNKNVGIHINAFNTTVISHTFEDGVGIVEFEGDVTDIGDKAFYQCGNITKLVLPKSITSIGNSSISGCQKLISINIPNGVTSIGDGAFHYCWRLTKIIIPTSVTSIGSSAFSQDFFYVGNFINNSSLDAEANNYWKATLADIEMNDGILMKNNEIVLFRGNNTDIIIPSGVTSIGEYAFSGDSYGGGDLVSITIPNSVTNIAASAFNTCKSLTSITIPNSVTSIGYNAFGGCRNMTAVVIGTSVTDMGEMVFCDCNNLSSVTVLATTPPTLGSYHGQYSNFSNTNDCPIYVPAASVDAYKSAQGWSTYASRIQAISE